MQRENISDNIETYLKTILAQEAAVEIRRAEIARRFNCVPSQINYVIKTRFTPARGYIVESKRGGGGYIRIVKVKLTDDQDLIQIMRLLIPSRLRMRDARDLIQELFDNGLIARQSGNLMLAVMDHETLG
ncbi:CtsR family transcriptional regulator, partial [Lacticaseibacillus paracasei]